MATMKAHTDYDFENLQELQRVVGEMVVRQQTRVKRFASVAWGVGFVVGGTVLLLRNAHALLVLFCLLFGLMQLVRGIFFYSWTALGAYRSMGKNRAGNDFFFEKSEILAVSGRESSRYPYQNCTQLLETRNNMYFIMENGQGLMVDKGSVKGGTVDELKKLLQERSGTEWKQLDF